MRGTANNLRKGVQTGWPMTTLRLGENVNYFSDKLLFGNRGSGNTFLVNAIGFTEEQLNQGLYFEGYVSDLRSVGSTKDGADVIQLKTELIVMNAEGKNQRYMGGALVTLTGTLEQINNELKSTGYEVYQRKDGTYDYRKILKDEKKEKEE